MIWEFGIRERGVIPASISSSSHPFFSFVLDVFAPCFFLSLPLHATLRDTHHATFFLLSFFFPSCFASWFVLFSTYRQRNWFVFVLFSGVLVWEALSILHVFLSNLGQKNIQYYRRDFIHSIEYKHRAHLLSLHIKNVLFIYRYFYLHWNPSPWTSWVSLCIAWDLKTTRPTKKTCRDRFKIKSFI